MPYSSKVAPVHTGLLLAAETAGFGLTLTVTIAVLITAQLSVIVTVYVVSTAGDTLTIADVLLVGSFHKYVYGAPPPTGVAVSIALDPAHMVGLFADAELESGATVTVAEAIAVQPSVVVTVTLYVVVPVTAVANGFCNASCPNWVS